MSSIVIEVADAVVRALNAGTFSQQFTAERSYDPERTLAEYKTLRVTVVPQGRTVKLADRSRLQQDVTVDVAVQRRVATDAESDQLMALVDEILDYLSSLTLKDVQEEPLAVWRESQNEPIFVPEHLHEDHVFTSIVSPTFRVIR